MRVLCLLIAVACLGAACGRIGYESGASLDVVVVTGLVPGPEFASVETRVIDTVHGTERALFEARSRFGENYAAGQQVASARLPRGEYRVQVRLRRPNGHWLVTQDAQILLRGDYVLRVHITRDCVGVDCPGSGSAALTACLNGRCVDPECIAGNQALCPEITFCNAASECADVDDCAEQACDEGVCTPSSREGVCADDEWCNPELGVGCSPLVVPNGDLNEYCGTICDDPAEPCQIAYWQCDDSGARCTALGNRPAGTACGEGTVCDRAGACIPCVAGASCQLGCALGEVSCTSGAADCQLFDPLVSADVSVPCNSTMICIDGDACVPDGVCDASGGCVPSDSTPPGVLVAPTSGLSTTEMGGAAVLQISLASRPTADVSIAITSTDLGEGIVTSAATLTFTATDYDSLRTVTVAGVDDVLADGPQVYELHFVVTSADTLYDGLVVSPVSITNVDDETAGVTVTPTSGLVTTEAGVTASFSVRLNAAPSSDVTVAIDSNDASEGDATPSTLTFTTLNYAAPQSVTVTGVDDVIADGDQDFLINVGPASSVDPAYNGLDASDVSVTNVDNEAPGYFVTPTAGLTTSEGGLVASFTVVLNNAPLSDVLFDIASTDLTEGAPSPATLTFTAVNWNAPQTVNVYGVDDVVMDGTQGYSVEVNPNASSDAAYAGLAPEVVSLSNLDNETAGITITPSTGLVTEEAGVNATFTVSLDSQPSSSVLVMLTSSDTSEGTLSSAAISIPRLSWNVPQTVTIFGADDALADGNQAYTIVTAAAVSADSNYNGINPTDVNVTNLDNDTPAIVVAPTSLTTSETGTSANFSVRLATMPTGVVTIDVTSGDLTEATVSPASLTFNTSSWSTPKTVTVSGVDDPIADGDQPVVIDLAPPTTADLNYAAIDPANVSVTNLDDDIPNIQVSASTGLHTSETGTMHVVTVQLGTPPTAAVTIPVSTTDATEGTVNVASVVFPMGSVGPQTFTITGVDDALVDGDQMYSVLLAPAVSADSAYAGMDASDIALVNDDDDSPTFVITPVSVQTTEPTSTATFSVVLNTAPSSSVMFSLTSSDVSEATVSPSTLTFTTMNWSTPQTVTVSGVNDAIVDGNQNYTIVTSSALSSDPVWSGRDPADVSGVNADDDFVVRAVSVASDGAVGDSFSGAPLNGQVNGHYVSISRDGRYVGFHSVATNLVAGDTNGVLDAFVRDTVLGTTERISLGPDGSQGSAPAFGASMSTDGRYVVFGSSGGASWNYPYRVVWRRDRVSGSTILASVSNSGTVSSESSWPVAVTDAGDVHFGSGAPELVAGDTNSAYDVFRRQVLAATTVRESVGSGGSQGIHGSITGYGAAFNRAVTPDGRYAILVSPSTNWPPATVGVYGRFFLRDTVANVTSLVNDPNRTPTTAYNSYIYEITPDGRYVVLSSAEPLVPGALETISVYVYDRNTSSFSLESVSSAGEQANSYSYTASISDDGRYVVFGSFAYNLVPGVSGYQVYVRDRFLGTTKVQSINASGQLANGSSGSAEISGDGNWVVYLSNATNLVPGDANGSTDIFFAPRL